jgi:hypothetical protein
MPLEFSVAQQVLVAWGASAEEIPTSSAEESDWLAELMGFRLLVEEKTKLENRESRLEREMALRSGRVHGTTTSLVQSNRLSGIVRKARKQLASTATRITHDARVIWFTGVGFDAEAKHYQFMATLYGSTKIFELDKPALKECYYFRSADFYRFRNELDGAVAAFLTGDSVTMKFCLNTYSPRYQTLRSSPFAAQFRSGLIDPLAEEVNGDAYIADTDIDRTDSGAVLQYVQKKYGLTQAMNMDLNLATATVAMPRGK